MLNYLLIETSGSESFLILSYQNRQKKVDLNGRNQANELHEKLQELLTEFRASLPALDFIGVGRGPGSFTGSRIGVLVAKTLNYALNTPLLPFCSLLMFYPEKPTSLPPLMLGDAKSRGFSALHADKKEAFFLVSPEELSLLSKQYTLCFDHKVDLVKKGVDTHTLSHFEQVSPNEAYLMQHVEKAFLSGEKKAHDDVQVTYAFTP